MKPDDPVTRMRSAIGLYSNSHEELEAFLAEAFLGGLSTRDLARIGSSAPVSSVVEGLPKILSQETREAESVFGFALENKWVSENPARKLKNPTVRPSPTLPFDQEEVIRILAACDHYTDSYGRVGQPNAKKLRALVLLLRYSGLRIGDATSCPVERLQGARLLLRMHKTG